jgi:Fe-S-cluster containining protein
MLFVPWQYIADWKCNACGLCCKAYNVVLAFPEWLNIVKNYGVEKTVSGLNKLYIKKRSDGSCIFLYRLSNMHLCGLQHIKPRACKLWPFKVLGKPKFGYVKEAEYNFGGNKLYIYADSTCNSLKYGKPTWEFANQTLKEFIEIALGTRSEQRKTTAEIGLIQPYTTLQVPNVKFYQF